MRDSHYLIEKSGSALPKGGEKRFSRQLLLCTSNLALNKMPRREIILKERRQQNIGLPSNLTRRKRLFLATAQGFGCHTRERETEKWVRANAPAACLPVAALSFKKQISRRGSIHCQYYAACIILSQHHRPREKRGTNQWWINKRAALSLSRSASMRQRSSSQFQIGIANKQEISRTPPDGDEQIKGLPVPPPRQ